MKTALSVVYTSHVYVTIVIYISKSKSNVLKFIAYLISFIY